MAYSDVIVSLFDMLVSVLIFPPCKTDQKNRRKRLFVVVISIIPTISRR